jgi:predicted DNA-binding protein (MmcQ/YjbR family)
MSGPTESPAAPLMDLCRSLPGVTEDVKWGDNLVFSVGDKMFAIFNLGDETPFSFKVDEDAFDVLVQQEGIRPAPYLARHSWVLAEPDALPEDAFHDLLRDSHAIVAAKLSKKRRTALGIELS